MMATAICALVITSCVKGPDDIPPSPTPPTPKTPEQKYNDAFNEYVEATSSNPISRDQDWGFGLSKVAGARGFTRGSEKGYYVAVRKDIISQIIILSNIRRNSLRRHLTV